MSSDIPPYIRFFTHDDGSIGVALYNHFAGAWTFSTVVAHPDSNTHSWDPEVWSTLDEIVECITKAHGFRLVQPGEQIKLSFPMEPML